ncbi:sulfite exporter TauE/SafE family protein [Halomarina pelagica]|uniref:sulfite exporter TauE/SafE family protein n=1 Tax=Halomarina pelagica TaxID=2961599 RepID=UPI0020C2CC82|nr:sulfite exporter TauE/SafE family protein [Halomarina sp. BND7]
MSLVEPTVVLIVSFVAFGLLVGILFGFFGMGGSFFVTPALLVLGHSATTAVGTGLAFVFGTSLVAAVTHRDLGQIDYRIGALFVLGMSLGIEVGRRTLQRLSALGVADVLVSSIYVLLLAGVGYYMLSDYLHGGAARYDPARSGLTRFVRDATPPPTITVSGGATVSVWVVLAVAFGIGCLAGGLGVGGGFLVLPTLVYGFGMAETVAVGTDVFQIASSSAFGTLQYARQGSIHVSMVAYLLAGGIPGARIGARLTGTVDERVVKGYFGVVLLLGSVAVASKVVSHAYGVELLHDLSVVLLFGSAFVVSVLVLWQGFVSRERPTE